MGLPCKAFNTLSIDLKQQTTNFINSDESSSSDIKLQHELLNGFDDKEKAINVELKSSDNLSPGLTPKTRQYIKFAFVAVMIVIILNGICCTFITLRQSGALDKYFEQIVSEEEDALHTADEHDLSHDVDDDDDFADDADDENAMVNDISFSDLVKLRSLSEDMQNQNSKDHEKRMQKLRICISQMDDIKFNKLAALNSPFKE